MPSTAVAEPARQPIRFRGRSYMAFVLAPEPPVADWLRDLDATLKRSAGFFVGRPTVLDVSSLKLTAEQLATLLADLAARDIRIMGLEGADPALLSLGLPPLLKGGRASNVVETPEVTPEEPTTPQPVVAPPQRRPQSKSLIIDEPVRSGQSICFLDGDVTVMGAISSGAEVAAGGSIHIYGALRGRALAGASGNGNARIFCRKLEAELLAIDGVYLTADDMDAEIRGRATKAWLDGGTLKIAMLD